MQLLTYVYCPVSAILASAEEEEKHKQLSAVELHHASFTPFVESFVGALGHEALIFFNTLLIGCLVLGVRIIVMY